MALPTTRAEFKRFILTELGVPVQQIELSDEQIENQIDMALSYYADYHFDATEKQYYKYQVTNTDITNRYITIPENMIGVVNLFSVSDVLSSTSMFSIQYQIALNDLHTLMSSSLVPYYMMRMHMSLIEQMLVGKPLIRFSRHMNRCYIDIDWSKMPEGSWIVLEGYQVIDPDTYTNVWKDRWLIRYATQLVKRSWGEVIKKYTGVKMISGTEYNGQKTWDEANAEIAKMEQEMILNYSMPVLDMIG